MVDHDSQWDSGYRFFPELTATSADNRYQLRPIHWNDRDAIREWRNAQIDVLRQQNPLSANEQAWDLVVREGALQKQGMVSFAGRLSKEDTDAIRAYVVKQAWDAVARGEATAPTAPSVSAN